MLLLLAWTLTAVVSCGSGSGDDPGSPGTTPGGTTPVKPGNPENPGNPEEPDTGMPILFSASQQEEATVTRADTPLEDTDIKSFTVYGFKTTSTNALQTVFPGYIVNYVVNSANTSTTNTDGWEYVNQQLPGYDEQTIKYWDMGAKAYRFFGVAVASEDNKVSGVPVGTDYYKLTFETDAEHEENASYYSHLWYSTSAETGERAFGEPVRLEFIKPLSKVRFIFTFENESDAPTTELTNKSFRPSDGGIIKMKGDVAVTYGLTETSVRESFAVEAEPEGMTAFTQDYFEKKLDEDGVTIIPPYWGAVTPEPVFEKIYTVLPAPSGQSAYTMTVGVNGEPKTAVVPAEYMTWLPGYLYTYIFKVHVDGSVTIDNVQSAFTKWIEHEKENLTIYNW